ncbi:MAG: dihydrofolate reductase family protein, partial [Bacteroidia bacterium]|nr:dihydrofolate reductase family protein [Bacteroidia bacterium]
EGKNPVRIVLAEDLKTDGFYKIFNDAAKTIVFNSSLEMTEGNVHWIKIERNSDYLNNVLTHLHKMGIGSVLVEGGLNTLESFINKGLWDEMRVFVNGNLKFNEGIKAPKVTLDTDYQLVENNWLYTLYSNKAV